MPKKIPEHLRDKARKCIFCGEPGVTQTHVFPDWLDELIATGNARSQFFQLEDEPFSIPTVVENVRKQGSVFSQKPYLTCGACNNGWMNRFEDEMVKFSKPIFLGQQANLTEYQTRVLVGWLTLITILAQYPQRRHLINGLPVSDEEKGVFQKVFRTARKLDHCRCIVAWGSMAAIASATCSRHLF
jgi:hypothetical protein